MENLDMAEIEALWAQGKRIPMELAPVALWHLFEPPQPIEDNFMVASEEALGDLF